MKEEILSQQLTQIISTINDGAPELFKQILLSGYIFNIIGFFACILIVTVLIIIINLTEDDDDLKTVGILILCLIGSIILFIPISNLIKIIFMPKVYILAQLMK